MNDGYTLVGEGAASFQEGSMFVPLLKEILQGVTQAFTKAVYYRRMGILYTDIGLLMKKCLKVERSQIITEYSVDNFWKNRTVHTSYLDE